MNICYTAKTFDELLAVVDHLRQIDAGSSIIEIVSRVDVTIDHEPTVAVDA